DVSSHCPPPRWSGDRRLAATDRRPRPRAFLSTSPSLRLPVPAPARIRLARVGLIWSRPMTQDFARLAALGWSNHFQSQLGSDHAGLAAVRVTKVHRNALEVAGADANSSVLPIAPEDGGPATIGDWLLVDAAGRAVRL